MSGLIMAAQLILGLSLLVLVHELGHFLAARAFGIKVDKFFIFFDWGGKLFSKKIGDTEFGIGIIPLGGYCKIAGMIDESMDKEQMKQEPKPWEFRSKPAWQRLTVMVAGVVMNILVGVLIFTFSHLSFTKEYLPMDNVTDGIYAYKYARHLGFESGDFILSIDDEEVERTQDIFSTRMFFGEEVRVKRDNETHTIHLPDTLYRFVTRGDGYFIGLDNYPLDIDSVMRDYNAYKAGFRKNHELININKIPVTKTGTMREILHKHRGDTVTFKLRTGREPLETYYDGETTEYGVSGFTFLDIPVDNQGKIGVYLNPPGYKTKKYKFFTAMKYGWSDAFEGMYANVKGIGKVVSGQEKASESLQGPIGIAKIYGGVWDWQRFWMITGLISMILAFVNILPIPALDGGHVILLLVETVTRRKIPDRVMEVIQYIGLIIVVALMIFVIGNDIVNLFK